MTDDASPEAAGTPAGGPIPPVASFKIRKVPVPTAAERQRRRDAMAQAIKFGAAPYRDAEGKARYVWFKEANRAPVEAWQREPGARRGFRMVQQARQAAGQLIGHPEDQIEVAKRLGVIHHRQGRSVEGAAERGLFDAIWRYEHVWDSFTVPRRHGPDRIETGRIAAVAEEEARRLQAEDTAARGGFWVRDRKNSGLIYVVANPDPEEVTVSGEDGAELLIGQAGTSPSPQTPGLGAAPQPPATADDYFALLRQKLAPMEGGLVNRPLHEDPAGKTNKGVTQDTLDRLHQNKAAEYGYYPTDPATLSDDQIDTILRNEYFDPLHIWEVGQIPSLLKLAPELPEQLFDIAVLHGVGYAGRVIQEALFEVVGIDLRVMKNGKLDYDGIVGPATRSALARAVAAGKVVEVNDLIVDKRVAELNSKGHKIYNPGWFPRAESFRIQPTKGSGAP